MPEISFPLQILHATYVADLSPSKPNFPGKYFMPNNTMSGISQRRQAICDWHTGSAPGEQVPTLPDCFPRQPSQTEQSPACVDKPNFSIISWDRLCLDLHEAALLPNPVSPRAVPAETGTIPTTAQSSR